MLEIGMNQVTQNYGFTNVLNGVNLEIMTGDRVAIVGRNGTGKSTMLKIIAGQEAPTGGLVTLRRGATVGYLEQIPRLVEQDTDVRRMLTAPFAHVAEMEARLRRLEGEMAVAGPEELEQVMRRYASQQSAYEAAGGYEVEERIARVVSGFALEPLLERPFNVLSGGQKTIVMLACVILRQPDILLLDEPTNHLDVRALEWFEGYLAKYAGTVVLVSHDRYFLDQVATKTVILDRGQTVTYHGNYTFSQREQERELLVEFAQYKNQQKKIEAMQAAIKRYRDWAAQSDNAKFYRKAKELERRLEKMEVLDRPQLEKPRIPIAFAGSRTSRILLRLEEVDLSVAGLSLLRGANLTLYYQDKACLLGPNGCGKTTLLRAILSDPSLVTGEVTLASNAKIGYIPQEIRFEDDRASVLEVFRSEHPCPEGTARGILAKYFFFGEQVYKRVSALSGGEKVLLKLAVLVQREINFLILDEPTNHIDIETREMLEESLLDFGGSILFISHDRYFIQKIASRIFAIEGQALATYHEDYAGYRKRQ